MHERALAWAGDVIGAEVVEASELTGGMTSTMLALTDATGAEWVLRLMTNQPWRSHGAALTARERAAQQALTRSAVPVPRSIALDAGGRSTGVAAHLMSRVPGVPMAVLDDRRVTAMAEMLATIHDAHPPTGFRPFESWAWPGKWVVPPWTRHPESWQRAFAVLAADAPPYEPTLLHRDFGHRNLLWTGEQITGVVDWVETSVGPAWLDAAHAATNLAVAQEVDQALAFLETFATMRSEPPHVHWLVMDAVGFLPPPGSPPLFGSPQQLDRLDDWLHRVVSGELGT